MLDTDRTDNDRMTYDRKNRVFIGGITEDIQKDEIEKEFNKYGKLTSVWVAQNPPGFAFVEYERESDAEEAVRSMNGNSIPGTSAKLRVEHSRGRSQGGRGGGRGRGGRGGFGDRDRFGGGSGRDGGRGGGYGGRGGGYSGGGRGGGFGGSRGPYSDRGGRGDRRGGGGGGRYDSRSGGSSRGRDRDGYDRPYGGHDSYKSSGSSNYPNYRSRSPLSGGRSRQSFGARDYSPSGVNSYSSGGNYMSGGNSGY